MAAPSNIRVVVTKANKLHQKFLRDYASMLPVIDELVANQPHLLSQRQLAFVLWLSNGMNADKALELLADPKPHSPIMGVHTVVDSYRAIQARAKGQPAPAPLATPQPAGGHAAPLPPAADGDEVADETSDDEADDVDEDDDANVTTAAPAARSEVADALAAAAHLPTTPTRADMLTARSAALKRRPRMKGIAASALAGRPLYPSAKPAAPAHIMRSSSAADPAAPRGTEIIIGVSYKPAASSSSQQGAGGQHAPQNKRTADAILDAVDACLDAAHERSEGDNPKPKRIRKPRTKKVAAEEPAAAASAPVLPSASCPPVAAAERSEAVGAAGAAGTLPVLKLRPNPNYGRVVPDPAAGGSRLLCAQPFCAVSWPAADDKQLNLVLHQHHHPELFKLAHWQAYFCDAHARMVSARLPNVCFACGTPDEVKVIATPARSKMPLDIHLCTTCLIKEEALGGQLRATKSYRIGKASSSRAAAAGTVAPTTAEGSPSGGEGEDDNNAAAATSPGSDAGSMEM